MKSFPVYCAIFFACILIFGISACSNSYTNGKSVSRVAAYPAIIEKAKKNHRYFVMTSGINIYTVTSVEMDQAKQQMTVTLDRVDSSRIGNTKDLAGKTSNIHLYMTDSTSYTLDEPHTIPLQKVARVEQ